MAESINGLYKSELIYNETQGPWRTVEDVELATLGWVDWWNHRRILSSIDNMAPAEFEARWLEKQPTGSPQSADRVASAINMAAEHEPLVGFTT